MGTSKSLVNVIYLACASPAFEIVEIFSRLISFRQSNMIYLYNIPPILVYHLPFLYSPVRKIVLAKLLWRDYRKSNYHILNKKTDNFALHTTLPNQHSDRRKGGLAFPQSRQGEGGEVIL